MLRTCALVIGFAAAGTASAYPVVVARQSDAVRAEREREFRKRNPISIKTIEVGQHGFIKHVVLDEPTLVPALTFSSSGWQWPDASVAAVRDFLRANADLFGFDPATADRLSWTGNPGLVLDDVIGGAVLGEINVRVVGKTLDIAVMFWIDVHPKLTEADIAKRAIGATYAETIGYAAPPQLDCSMTEAGRAGCKMPIQHRRQRVVTLGATDVQAVTWLLPQGDTIRLVACVDADQLQDPPAEPSWGNIEPAERQLAPRGKAPMLPLVVDLVTGAAIAIRVPSCYGQTFVDVRDSD